MGLSAEVLLSLIGKDFDDPKIVEFIDTIADNQRLSLDMHSYPPIKDRPACEFHNYKKLGFSICYEKGKVEAVHIYNGTQGYVKYAWELPYGLDYSFSTAAVAYAFAESTKHRGAVTEGSKLVASFQNLSCIVAGAWPDQLWRLGKSVRRTSGLKNIFQRTIEQYLPEDLTRIDMLNSDVVRLLGEPDIKVGGGRSGPVIIGYKDRTLQISFVGSTWEDVQNPVDCITLYRKPDR